MISQPAVIELTTRELQIMEYVASGRTNADIADRLSISPHTVRNHLANIFEKLGAHSRWQAITLVFGQRRLCDIVELADRSAPWATGHDESLALEQVA